MQREPQTCQTEPAATIDPAALVAMLYDKAISSLKTVVQAIHSQNIETCWNNNRRAQEIISHLFMALDLEKGGEISSNLEALYTYMLRRLLDVGVNNDARAAEEVIELLEPLRASWKELAASTDFKMDQQEYNAIASIALDSAA